MPDDRARALRQLALRVLHRLIRLRRSGRGLAEFDQGRREPEHLPLESLDAVQAQLATARGRQVPVQESPSIQLRTVFSCTPRRSAATEIGIVVGTCVVAIESLSVAAGATVGNIALVGSGEIIGLSARHLDRRVRSEGVSCD